VVGAARLKSAANPQPCWKLTASALLQQAKRAARGFRTATNLINIACLRMSKLKHLPTNSFASATTKWNRCVRHETT
jgi:hypothetical protein